MLITDRLQNQLDGLRNRGKQAPVTPDSYQPGGSLTDAQTQLEQLAAKGNHLAQVALKAVTEGDSTLGDLGVAEMMSAGAPVELLTQPVRAVFEATLATLVAGPSGNAVGTMAHTGLEALKRCDARQNPLGPALAAEPFLIGLSELSEDGPAAEVCEFLQSEIPATMAQFASEAYRVVLEGLDKDPSSDPNALLAASGKAALNAMPGQEQAAAQMVGQFFEKLGSSENPILAKLASETADLGESYLKAEDENEKKKVVPLYQTSLDVCAKLAAVPLRDAESFGKVADLALEGVGAMPEAEKLAGEVWQTFADECGAPLVGFAEEWRQDLPFPAQLAIMRTATHELSAELKPEDLPKIARTALDAAPPEHRQAMLDALCNAVGDDDFAADLRSKLSSAA